MIAVCHGGGDQSSRPGKYLHANEGQQKTSDPDPTAS